MAETITVLGREIQIVEVETVDLKDPDTLAEWRPEKDTIELTVDLEPSLRERCLKHEKFHAMLDISGLTNLLDPKLEEALCNLVENF